jgi:hypothetical protein
MTKVINYEQDDQVFLRQDIARDAEVDKMVLGEGGSNHYYQQSPHRESHPLSLQN